MYVERAAPISTRPATKFLGAVTPDSAQREVVLLEGCLDDSDRCGADTVQLGQVFPRDAREVTQGGVPGCLQGSSGRGTYLR